MIQPLRLGVNVDHVATLRQARRGLEPDPVWAAVAAQLGGADGITVHLREDRRHIQDRDLRALRDIVTVRLNLEMAAVDGIATLACVTRPEAATLVPERREELTTEGGLDVIAHERVVRPIVQRLKDAGILVSLFIDPDARQIEAARHCGGDAVELQTASYAEARTEATQEFELDKLSEAARHAHAAGLRVHAGHGLNYVNVLPVAGIPAIEELNIGHAIVSRSIFVGMEAAVREMKQLLSRRA